MIGSTINQYHIIDRIGKGGMGIVYLANDTRLGRKVALKFVSTDALDSTEETARFNREARAAARLNHPNICTVHELGESDDKTFIAMEYVEGITLKTRIEQGDISENEIRDWIKQIAEGLHKAHEAGVVHRDIKPANIMITDSGLIKIMDFGIAKLLESDTELTRANSTIGTIAYMSPEQARGEEINRQTDIWSIGVILYELTTGERPFAGAFREAVMYAMMNDDSKAPSTINPDVATDLEAVIEKCLQRDQEERYTSLESLLDDLSRSTQTRESLSASQAARGKLGEEEGEATAVNARTRSGKIVTKKHGRSLSFALGGLVILIVFGFGIAWYMDYQAKVKWAREDLLPKIEQLAEDISWTGEGPGPSAAYELIEKAERYIPDDPLLVRLIEVVTRRRSVVTNPEGVDVYVKPYADVDSVWQYLGKSPLHNVRLPVGFSRIKLDKKGLQTVEDIVWINDYTQESEESPPRLLYYSLSELGSIPENMVLIPDSSDWYNLYAAPSNVHIPGMENIDRVRVGDFLMDQFEVTNKEFKIFIDSGGYNNPDYWKIPFEREGKRLTFEDAKSFFIDRTGMTGPATWQIGDYPEGKDDYPVTGVSWYEAAAYAEFVGKSLPSIYHWDRASFTYASPEIVQFSNLSNEGGPIPVGDSDSINRFGVYDLAGNVREWSISANSRGGQYILGGGWNDAIYAFNDAFSLPPFNRSETNGFRCIKYLDFSVDRDSLESEIHLPTRDFYAELPVSDEVFAHYLRLFDYDKSGLNDEVVYVEDHDDWILEKVSFDAAYGDERMDAYLFLPKTGTPPYQTVVYFPGSYAIFSNTSDRLIENLKLARNEMFPKSGRALLYPIYKSTYERGDELRSDYPNETNFYKEHVVMWTKDLSRSIDYLETRDDVDKNNLAFYGFSWGSSLGGTLLAVETRFKASILYVGGLLFQRSLPEVEMINYLPRVKTPVLMINGDQDFFYPYRTSQIPFYDLLGTPEQDKQLLSFQGSHIVPPDLLIENTLSWLDKYLGVVE